MAVYDLNQAQFLGTIEANFDSVTQDQILAYLNTQGIYVGGLGTAAVQLDTGPILAPPADENPAGHPAQIAVFSATNLTPPNSIDTDANTDIKAIIAQNANSNFLLSGSESVLLASGNGADTLVDVGNGANLVIGGNGDDLLNYSGQGADTMLGDA